MEEPATWNIAAENAVSTIEELVRKKPKIAISDLRDRLDKFIDSMYSAPGGNSNAITHFAQIGADSWELSTKAGFHLSVPYVTNVLVKKQRDYGPENIARFQRQGLLIRLHDKVARLENLAANERDPNNESIEDTYLDIVGYTAIGVMWERRQFLLPLK